MGASARAHSSARGLYREGSRWQAGRAAACRPQGLGSPACARILTSWYPDRERGTFWGFWTASNNIGGFLAPIIAGNAAAHYGWRCGP